MREQITVELENVTEDIAARVRAGEVMAWVITPKAKFPQAVAVRTYRAVHITTTGNYTTEEKRLEVYKDGHWSGLTNQLLKVFNPDAYAARMAAKAARKAKAATKAAQAAENVKVGDIFVSCWGYEQTNREFYEVVKKNGQFVTVREICQNYEPTGFMSGNITPRSGEYVTGYSHIQDNEKGKRCKVNECGYIKINDVVDAFKWSGRPMDVSSYA